MLRVFYQYIYLFKRLRLFDRMLIWVCIAMVSVQIVIPLANVMFPKVVVWAISGGDDSMLALMIALLCFFLVSGFCNATQSYFDRRNGFYLSNFSFKLQEDIQELSMRMPFPMTEDAKILDRIRLAKEGGGRVQRMIEACMGCIASAFLLIMYAILLIRLDWRILLVFVACTVADIFIMKQIKEYEVKMKSELATIGRRKHYLFNTMSDYRFGKELRIFGMKTILEDRYREQCQNSLEIRKRVEKYRTKGEIAGAFLRTAAELTIYLTMLFLFLQKELAADDFVMYVGIATSFHMMSVKLVESGTDMILLGSSIEDYQSFVEKYRYILEEKPDVVSKRIFPIGSSACTIVFDNVSFTYPGCEKKILNHVSFTLEAGKQTVLVGENGAGKSTIVRLLCRFYAPDEGRIFLDDRDIQDYGQEEYFARISAVFQESVLYAGTLEENICLHNPPDKTRLWNVLRMVGMDRKVEQLPAQEKSNILKYIYDDGVEFSGGERQRLCIARAVYKESDLLLLDEPTAALDALAEKEIYESFSKISKGRTVLFISHRLNSNRLCDKVIFMEKGCVKDQGNHDELMRRCDDYREMYNLQAQYYVKEGDVI